MNTNYRKIFIISVLIICIVAINMAVFSQITKKPKKSKDEKETVDTTKLVEEFEAIFNNKIDIQENKIQVQKIDSNKVCTLPELLSYKGLQKQDTQDKINETIQKSINDVNQYKALGYERYLRNINDSMYKIENTTTFFLGSNKTFYIIYPYGNSNYTSEFDLVSLVQNAIIIPIIR